LRTEGALRLLHLALQLPHRLGVSRDIDAVSGLDDSREVRDDALVEIFAAEAGVAGGGEDLEGFVFEGEEGNVECSAAEVVD
jgi:hypothetical protein